MQASTTEESSALSSPTSADEAHTQKRRRLLKAGAVFLAIFILGILGICGSFVFALFF